jgi:hypothetical protein
MTISRFEDLECWQEARKLVKMIYAAFKSNPEFQKTIQIVDGLIRYLRSSISKNQERP